MKFKKHIKPYWNNHLTNLHKNMMFFRKIWIIEGRPRNNTHESYKDYKLSKKMFRNELSSAYEEYMSSLCTQIQESLEADQKLAWSVINCRKIKSDDKVLYSASDVCNEFAKHFESIAMVDESYNDSDDIFRKLQSLRSVNHEHNIRPVDINELSKLLNSLPNKKACGIDGISYEHLKYGGKLLARHLCQLFNLIFDQCVTPIVWKDSVIIPLYKDGNKSKTDINSYRGISLIPSICKVFEKLIDWRLNDMLINFPTPQQMAYQKQLCSMFASFNLQVAVHHYLERNSSVIVTFLDSKRAFNTVDHNDLS